MSRFAALLSSLLLVFVFSFASFTGCTSPKPSGEETQKENNSGNDGGDNSDADTSDTDTSDADTSDNDTSDTGQTDKGDEIDYPNLDELVVHPDARKYDSEKDVKFFVDESGRYATMVGVINTSTPEVFAQLRKNHPKVVLIVMYKVPGSDNDDANLQVSREVRKAKMATYVPADGLIASGGTDFFIAGVKRAVAEGGKVGVHAWKDNDSGKEATDYPEDSPVHTKYIEYYKEMGMSEEEARNFYFFTIKAAPAAEMYNMKREELEKYKLVTN